MFAALAEQAEHCQVVPEATDDASLGRVYAANGSIPEVKDVPDKVFELLDFQLLGRRIRQSAGGVFTRQGYVVPDGNWKPTEGQELRIAPEAPTGFFRLELRLGEERAELTLPPDRSWWRCGSGWRPWASPTAPSPPSTAGYPSFRQRGPRRSGWIP